jgi:chemotaxis protein CheX
MQLEQIRPFVDSARTVLGRVVDEPVEAGRLRLQETPAPCRGVAAIVGLAGEVEGRVILDMDPETALRLAGRMSGEPMTALTPLAQDTLGELVSMMAGRAVTTLHDRGFHLQPTPALVLVGENMTVTTPGTALESLVIPLGTGLGEVVVNVAVRIP